MEININCKIIIICLHGMVAFHNCNDLLQMVRIIVIHGQSWSIMVKHGKTIVKHGSHSRPLSNHV